VPRAASETRSPLLPSNLYFIIVFPSFALRFVSQFFINQTFATAISSAA
jgi:hypothetical protein